MLADLLPEKHDNEMITETPTSILTPRWTPLRHHEQQQALLHSPYRFNVVPAGRRSGKTEITKRKLVIKALEFTAFPDGQFIASAPTHMQAKKLFWDDLKQMVPLDFVTGISETELAITLITGAQIRVVGLDKPQRVEGSPVDWITLDEFDDMRADVWQQHIRPALSTEGREGGADFIGVPEGRKHFYDLYKYARADKTGEWQALTWFSADILSPAEIESARNSLDELTFKQEYEASFVTFEGRAYYTFDEKLHVRKDLSYDDEAPLIFCFDFNNAPGVAVVAQEMRVRGEDVTGIIGEVHIPRNSTTPLVCNRLLKDWSGHRGRVHLYGDATGGAKTSSSVAGSDWDLVKDYLHPVFQNRLKWYVPRANGAERARVNAVNSRLKSIDEMVRLIIDPARAPNLIKDFEGVRTVKGGSGEIDKKADKRLTHLTDAIGYYVVNKFPLGRQRTVITQLL